MINQSTIVSNLTEAMDSASTIPMDSKFENSIVAFLRTADPEGAWQIVSLLLTNPRARTRTLGLRVVRRQFKDKALLERVIGRCFDVGRYSELEHWYAAILARYPMLSFMKKLEMETSKREDVAFIARHLRALEMHKAIGCKTKKIAVTKLTELASSAEWATGSFFDRAGREES